MKTYITLIAGAAVALSFTGCGLTQNYAIDKYEFKGSLPVEVGEDVKEQKVNFEARLNQERNFAELDVVVGGNYEWDVTTQTYAYTESEDRMNGLLIRARGASTAVNVEAVSEQTERDENFGDDIGGAVESVGDTVSDVVNPISL